MAENPGEMSELCSFFDVARDFRVSALRLGVFQHPQVQALLRQKKARTTDVLRAMQFAMHRCDLGTQFMDLSAERATHSKKREQKKREAQASRQPRALQAPRQHAEILKRFIIDDFRSMADASSFFSLPRLEDGDVGAYQLFPMDMGYKRCRREPLDCDVAAEAPDCASSTLVFRLLHGTPSAMKYAPAPLASSPLFPPGASVIAVHEVHCEGAGRATVGFSASGAPQLLQDLHECSLDTLRQHLLEWNVSKCAYTLPCPDCPSSSVIELVTSLLEAKAIPDEPYKAVPDGLAGVCSQLNNSGFVQLVPNRAEGGLWGRLTELAMRSVQAVCFLDKPRPVCRIRNAAAALTEYTIMELALALEEQGWRWEALPRNVARRKQLAHTADSQRVWYSLSHAVNKLYMLCLLQADELFAQGVEFIPHWCKRPKEVYTQLFSTGGRSRLASCR